MRKRLKAKVFVRRKGSKDNMLEGENVFKDKVL